MTERKAGSTYNDTDKTPIRDAACVVVIDYESAEPTLLMGRRHADQVFLPDKWVFPGGRVDDFDRRIAWKYPLTYAPGDLAPEIRAFAVAAVRELDEETGLLIGDLTAPPEFQSFCRSGGEVTRRYPRTSELSPLARAVTPPGRVRRYDTWFFTVAATAAHATRGTGDGELIGLDWFTVAAARRLDLPNITRLILEDVVPRLAGGSLGTSNEVPFYWPDSNGFRRTYTSCRGSDPAS